MVRDAGGSRTHSNAALQAAAVPSGSSVTSVLARNRTWTSTFAGLHAHPAHPEDVNNLLAARRGVEPRLAVSRTAVRSGTLAGCVNQYPDLDLNQGLDLRRVQCKSATPSGQAEPTTGFAPASAGLQDRCLPQSSHVGKPARVRGVEPRGAVLEAAGSPRSTLVGIKRGIRRESNPYLLVHSQACSTPTPQTP